MRAYTLAHISLFLLGRLFALFLAGFPAFEKAESAVGFVALLPVFFSYCERHGGSLSVRNHRFVVLLIRLTHTLSLAVLLFSTRRVGFRRQRSPVGAAVLRAGHIPSHLRVVLIRKLITRVRRCWCLRTAWNTYHVP